MPLPLAHGNENGGSRIVAIQWQNQGKSWQTTKFTLW
jgi:hypothetical protein